MDSASYVTHLLGYRFTGKEKDAKTKLIYFGARYDVNVVTNDAGDVISAIDYLPYGETWYVANKTGIVPVCDPGAACTTQSGDTGFSPKYNSQELDKESGLYFFNARHYDPEIMRFETADSVVDGEHSVVGWNRYTYVHGNPVMYKDPSGHEREAENAINKVSKLAETISVGLDPESARGQAYKNFTETKDKDGKITDRFTVVDGIRFNLNHGKFEDTTRKNLIVTQSDKIWENIVIAAKKNDITEIDVNTLNYGGTGSHGKGHAMDIQKITTKDGKSANFSRTYDGEKWSGANEPELAKKFSDTFQNLSGSYHTWTPWRMSGGGFQKNTKNAIDEYPEIGNKSDRKELIKTFKEADMTSDANLIRLSYDHRHHGHFAAE